MGTAIVRANPRSVDDLFQLFFTVPSFQREYVWKQDHISALLTDIRDARDVDEKDSYFLGTVVVYLDERDSHNLVDGQQRLTTLYVLFCAIRDRILALDPAWNVQFLRERIAGTSVAKGGKSISRQRVHTQYEADREVLEKIGSGSVADLSLRRGQAGRPLLDAYTLCLEYLKDSFAEDCDALGSFAYFLLKNVEVILVETDDFVRALVIFERINDRGVGLSAVDLLKNLLFKESDHDDHPQLADEWHALISTLKKGGERNYIRFLRYFLVATYDFDRMPKAEEVFTWIIGHRSELGIAKNPLKFARELALTPIS